MLLKHAARASHHEFPYAMNVLAQLVGCTNGASTEIFPAVKSPLMLLIFNINIPQTRKSCGSSTGMAMGKEIDKKSQARADALIKESVDKKLQAASQPHAGPVIYPKVRINSCTLSSFTEAAFFQRCAGDWDQIVPR